MSGVPRSPEPLTVRDAQGGVEVTHVKPHGALNNVACVDTATAEAIARAVFGVSPALIMLAPAASELLLAGGMGWICEAPDSGL